MKKFRFIIGFIIVLLGVFSLVLINPAWAQSNSSETHEKVTVDFLCAPMGTGSYAIGVGYEKIINKYHPWLSVAMSETPGANYDVKKLGKSPEIWEDAIIIIMAIDKNWAPEAKGPYDEKMSGYRILNNYLLCSTFLYTLDPSIKTLEDLKGKKVALGNVGQSNWMLLPDEVMKVSGFYDQIKISYLGPKGAKDALVDGKVDAAITGAYSNADMSRWVLPGPIQEVLGMGKDVYYIGFGQENVEKAIVQKNIGGEAITVPPKTIDENQVNALELYRNPVAYGCHKDFPEDKAYELTKTILANLEKWGGYHNLAKLLSPESLIVGWDSEDLHPGALKAYKEAGVAIEEK